MTTLIAGYNSDGCSGRCDAKCYDAIHPACDCICGGANHGVGQRQALENTRDLAQAWIDEYERRTGERFDWVIGDDVRQRSFSFMEVAR